MKPTGPFRSIRDALVGLLRRTLNSVAPRTAVTLLSIRARAHSQRLVREWGLYELNQRLIAAVGSRVLAGPFAGMVIGSTAHREHIGPFLLGTYESELHPWLSELREQRFNQVVDVGAKFGYYAIGFALWFPDSEVTAFDTDPWARRAMREGAALNGIGNLLIRGYCDPGWFEQSLRPRALVFSDCEGYEGELFPRIRSEALRTATLLIEVHDQLAPGASENLTAAFAETHEIRRVASERDEPTVAVPHTSFSDAELRRLAKEIRGEQEWLLITPRATRE